MSAIMTATLLGACDDDPSAGPATSAPASTFAPRIDDGQLSIGVLLPQTGPGASLGVPMVDAVQQAVAEIRATGGPLGRPIQLTVVDEDAGNGVALLLDSGVDAIIGPASSQVALSQLGAAVQPDDGVVVCSPSATALALDAFPDNKLFFRTVPSDSLQMAAIARRAERTGVASVAVGYLDDPYGRDLAEAFVAEIEQRNLMRVTAEVGFGADEGDLGSAARNLLQARPGVVVVLADADDGGRLLTAIDAELGEGTVPHLIVNDAIRSARQSIQSLRPTVVARITGVAPVATAAIEGGPAGFFTANAVDCLNLVALAAVQASSDSPRRIQANMAAVSVDGSVCTTYRDCATKLSEGLQIDYNGMSGPVELSTTTGDLVRGRFEVFGFDVQGNDISFPDAAPFEVS